MQQIIFFFIRNKNFLLFFVLFTVSVFLTVNSHSFHKNNLVNSSNFLSGSIYSFKSGVTNYFDLKKQNKLLTEENMLLRYRLEGEKEISESQTIDSVLLPSKYRFVTATVINNSYSKTKNNLTLNKGLKDSIFEDMGVITSSGIVGIINNVSNKYATVQSILNTKSQINAKLKNSNHFGSLVWDAKNPAIVKLIDVPRIAAVALGDTITTGGKSTIFPEGILIGIIKDFSLDEGANYYDLNIQLFNDMTSVNHVYVIENTERPEIKQLENEVEDAAQ